MYRNSLLALLIVTGIGLALALIPETGATGFGSAFALAFGIGGLVWLVLAYLSGGFVSTYTAPIPATRSGNPLLYALPDEHRAEMVLPEASSEVVADLQRKMAEQPSAMVVALLKGLAFFGLAAVFYISPLPGIVVLAVAIGVFTVLFLASRPRSGMAAGS